jgi:hypothetical protein
MPPTSSATVFDTYSYVKRLVGAGMSEAQAEIQVEAVVSFLDERVTTKHDLQLLQRDMVEMDANLRRDIKEIEANLKRDIKEIEANLKRDIKEMELVLRGEIEQLQLKLTIRLGAILTAGLVILATLVKLL